MICFACVREIEVDHHHLVQVTLNLELGRESNNIDRAKDTIQN